MSKRRYKQLRAIKLGEGEDEIAFLSQVPESGLSQPACFKNPIDKANLQTLRESGFCPIHRHPVMASYIQALHTLLSSEFSNCLQSVDLAKAHLIYPKEQDLGYKKIGTTHLDWLYDDYLVYPSELLDQGLRRMMHIETGEKSLKFILCKGFTLHHVLCLIYINRLSHHGSHVARKIFRTRGDYVLSQPSSLSHRFTAENGDSRCFWIRQIFSRLLLVQPSRKQATCNGIGLL